MRTQNFIESECFFPLPDFGDEALLKDGKLTGSLHGLVPKSDKAAAEGFFFRQQLGQLDWSELKTPPALLNSGVVGGQGQGLDAPPRNGVAGRSSSPRMAASSLEQERSHGRGGEGVVVGVVGGVLASACVVTLVGAIKRGRRGDRSYEDISKGGNAW